MLSTCIATTDYKNKYRIPSNYGRSRLNSGSRLVAWV